MPPEAGDRAKLPDGSERPQAEADVVAFLERNLAADQQHEVRGLLTGAEQLRAFLELDVLEYCEQLCQVLVGDVLKEGDRSEIGGTDGHDASL